MQARARDTQRKQDLSQIQSALTLYRADHGNYPPSYKDHTACTSHNNSLPNRAWCNSVSPNNNGRWIANGALSSYLNDDPVDPNHNPEKSLSQKISIIHNRWRSDGALGVYFYISYVSAACREGDSYILVASMEIEENKNNGAHFCGESYYGGGSYHLTSDPDQEW